MAAAPRQVEFSVNSMSLSLHQEPPCLARGPDGELNESRQAHVPTGVNWAVLSIWVPSGGWSCVWMGLGLCVCVVGGAVRGRGEKGYRDLCIPGAAGESVVSPMILAQQGASCIGGRAS